MVIANPRRGKTMTESKVPGVFAFDMITKAEDKPDFEVITFDNNPYTNEVLTYADLVIKGNKLARAMEKIGIGRGDTFCIVMRNHLEVVLSMYAASVLGALLVPIDPRSKREKLRYQIQDSGSKGVIFAAEFMTSMDKTLSGLPDVKVIGCLYNQEFGVQVRNGYPPLKDILDGPEVPGFDPNGHSAEDMLMIVYTSGTTGSPKGIHIRSDRSQGSSMYAESVWEYNADDKLYTGLSLTHGNAQFVTLFPSLYNSIPAVISRRFTKSRIWDICREHGCTIFSLLGGMMMGIYSEPLKPEDAINPVRKVLSAGTPRGIWKSFEARFNLKVHEWYGAMEGGFAHNPPGTGPIGSFGKPLEGLLEMKVVREDDTPCNPGEIGELVSRNVEGETIVEYHGNQGASEEKTRGGWLQSGDMCHIDDNGWFYFDFRKGGGLRRQGDFIMPEYVEGVMAEHDDIDDVCVYGVNSASGAPGERDLVAAVVLFEDRSLDIKSLFTLCLKNLERNSVPSYIQVVTEIPKTASEKNLDRLLRDAFYPGDKHIYFFEDYF
jgi:acyl-coenzyme A synthetase/AMP-(fatty) acid ligase